MSLELLVIERDQGNIIALHVIPRPNVGESGFYRITTSIEAFRTRELNRIYSPGVYSCESIKLRHFSCYVKEIWEAEQDATYAIMERLIGNPVTRETHGKPIFNHESIWTFYKAIGYDYKKRKYI